MAMTFDDSTTLRDIEKFRKREGDLIIQISKPRGCCTWFVRLFKPSPSSELAPSCEVAWGSSKHSIGTALDNAAHDYERFKLGLHNG